MKKFILLMMLALIAFVSHADSVCVLSNAGETVQIKSYSVNSEKDNVSVTLINDSNVTANITITVKVEYTGFYSSTFTATHLVKPGEEDYDVTIKNKVAISLSSYANYKGITSIDITGYKCRY